MLELDDGRLTHDTTWPHDTITDLAKGLDELAVRASEFGGTQATFRLTNSTSNVTAAAGAAFIFETDAHRLWFDLDGTGTDSDGDGAIDTNVDPILIATLGNLTSLALADFGFHD